MTPRATRSSFGSVYLHLALVAIGIAAGYLFLSRQFVVPRVVHARAEGVMALIRSQEENILLNRTRALRNELQTMDALDAGHNSFHNFTADEKEAVEAALRGCRFISASICLGPERSVFFSGKSAAQFNFAVVLDSDLSRPPLHYYGVEALTLLLISMAFFILYRAISAKERYLLSRLLVASSAFSKTQALFSLSDSKDEFDAFGKSAEELVAGLKAYKEKFERKTRLEQLGLTIGRVSHDLKAPLNEAENFLAALPKLMGKVEPAEIKVATESLIARIQNGKAALNQALQQTKLETVATQKLPLGEVLESVTLRALEDPRLSALGIRLFVGKDSEILGDRLKLETALLNLLENAADEKLDASVKLALDMSPEGKARILFQDNGSGIPDEFLEKVFEPLVTFKAGGSGLGLSSTKEILAQHGGEIRALPSRGGASFEILLPLVEPSHA